MAEQKKVRCGEIYLYDFGEHDGRLQTGVKPVVVVQDNRLNAATSTTIVSVVEEGIRETYMPTHLRLNGVKAFDAPVLLLVEQVACVFQNDLGDCIGSIDDAAMKRSVQNSLKKVFGMWNYTPKGSADVRCLCPKCLRAYMQAGRYIVRRLDPFSSKKDFCDKCNSLGYDYVLIEHKKQRINQ